jgi:hypothetical protein
MDRPIRRLTLVLCFPALAWGGDLAPATAAKLIRVIVQASGQSKVACTEKELAGELATLGVGAEPDAKVIWATAPKDVARLAAQHRLVVCPNPDWLAEGASVAITAEGGRPSIYLQVKNLAGVGVTLPDSIVKISKVVK